MSAVLLVFSMLLTVAFNPVESAFVKSLSSAAADKNQTIACSDNGATRFTATLDHSSFVPGSGYFDVRDAFIMDNYNMGQLICIGSTLKNEISCVGFNNGMGSQVFDVIIAAGGKSLMYTMLKGNAGPEANKPWACTVTDAPTTTNNDITLV